MFCAQSPLSCITREAFSVSVKCKSRLKAHCAVLDSNIRTCVYLVMREAEYIE